MTTDLEQPRSTRPLLPEWARSRSTFLQGVRWGAGYYLHVSTFHLLRLPLYYFRLVALAPFGLGRIVRGVYRWTVDADGMEVRAAMKETANPNEWKAITDQRQKLVGRRVLLTAVGVILIWYAFSVLIAMVPNLAALAVLVAAAVALLGLAGRTPTSPITSRAVDSIEAPKLTDGLILTALASLRIANLTTNIEQVKPTSPIHRDGQGWRAELDLPPGVTAGEVIDKRAELASGLRRPLSSVWPSTDPEAHPGRLVLYVADKPMSKARPVAWPLLKSGKVDLFQPFPVGVDPQGRTVTVCLMFALTILGAIPRMGKSFTQRLLVLAAALDPTAELHIFDLRGSADWMPLEPVAHRFRVGDDEDDLAYLRADIKALKADMQRRYKVIKSLPHDVCPEGKATRDLADRRDLGLHPIVLTIDECFPAGTLVGGKPIDLLAVGDIVPSWDEETRRPCNGEVVHVFRSRPSGLVRVQLSDGASLVCTPGHPLMTRRGWQPASALTPFDELLSLTHGIRPISRGSASACDLHMVRESLRDHAVLPGVPMEAGGKGLLLTPVPGCGHQKGSPFTPADPAGEGRPFQANDRGEPHAGPRGARASVRHTEAERSPTTHSWWEREAAPGAGSAARVAALMGYGSRRANADASQSGWNANALQAGHREPELEGGDRGRRRVALPSSAAGSRCPEDGVADWRRVDRVEVLESGSDGRYGGLCPDGLVYNIEVAGTHTYRVNDGIVAHNCQVAFDGGDKEIAKDLEDLARRGPAAGIMVILSTQRVDAKSLPPGISSNAALRFCLKVMGHTENNMVLGSGMYKAGYRATIFDRTDTGVGYLAGEGYEPRIVRAAYIDRERAEAVVARARAARLAAGLLTGHAAGQEIEPEDTENVLDHLAAVWPTGEGKVWLDTLADRLAEAHPALYGGWTGEQVTAAVKPHGIKSVQVGRRIEGKVQNRRGLLRESLTAALDDRAEWPGYSNVIALPRATDQELR